MELFGSVLGGAERELGASAPSIPLPGDEIQTSRFQPKCLRLALGHCLKTGSSPGEEPAVHSPSADVGAHLASRQNAALQVAGAAPKQTQPQRWQRSAAQTHTCTGYCPADHKEPLEVGSMMGFSLVRTVSVYLPEGTTLCPWGWWGKGGGLQKFACFSCLMTFWPRLKVLDQVFDQEPHPSVLPSSKPSCPTSAAGWSWKCPTVTRDLPLLLLPTFLA